MIISSATDFREAARRKLPPFLFHYLDGGAGAEETLRANVSELQSVRLRQRVLRGAEQLDLGADWFGRHYDLPIALAPVGLTGMYARRGEVQAVRAADRRNIPFIQSTVSVCPLSEVAAQASKPIWFQLYVLKDRAFMRDVMQRARELGATTLVFTVDMPVPGARYRDAHSGMSGPNASLRRVVQAMLHPRWAWDVGLFGRPHDLGHISAYRGEVTGLEDYIGWLGANFDPAIAWHDLQWIRDEWKGKLVIKGILDADDARDALAFGADGIVVSNHGGRQLDGAISTAQALPDIADAVKGKMTIFADGGVRTGTDVFRMLALGADGVLLGRAFVYALATMGQAGVEKLLDIMAKDLRTNMVLTGVKSVREIGPHLLAAPPRADLSVGRPLQPTRQQTREQRLDVPVAGHVQRTAAEKQ